MAKQAGRECLTTVVGGMSVSISSADSSLLTQLSDYLEAVPFDGAFDVSIRIEQAEKMTATEVTTMGSQFSERINGEEEYTAYIDYLGSSVLLLLHGEYPLEATMNCLRQIIRRRIYREGGIVLHAACIQQGSSAVLFYGPSGAGKSTVCSFAGSEDAVLSDDLTALKWQKNGWMCWGLPGVFIRPHSEKAACHHSALTGTPIKAVVQLIQDTNNKVEPLQKSMALASLMAVPAEDDYCDMDFGLIEKVYNLVEEVPCYRLYFQKNAAFWDVLQQQMEKA